MKQTQTTWKTPSLVSENEREIPVRVLIEREAADTRIFVARLVREYRESGRRAELARLLDRRNDVPWYLVKPEVRD